MASTTAALLNFCTSIFKTLTGFTSDKLFFKYNYFLFMDSTVDTVPTGVLIPADRSGSDHRFFLKLKKMVKYGTSKNLQLLLKKLYFCDKCFLCVGF